MRYAIKLVGAGLLLLTVAACGQKPAAVPPGAGPGSAAPTSGVAPTGSVPVPTVPTSNPPGKPRLTVPEGSTPVPANKIDGSALPEGFPREVWTANGGATLNVRAQEGGCGHALGQATEQTAAHVVINLTETIAQTGQMCTMDLRFPVLTVQLAAPLGERTVVLKYTPAK
jgi:predicted small lipoprotein YifL